jgi:hypothetical protein
MYAPHLPRLNKAKSGGRGHDFLDRVREPGAWDDTKKASESEGLGDALPAGGDRSSQTTENAIDVKHDLYQTNRLQTKHQINKQFFRNLNTTWILRT